MSDLTGKALTIWSARAAAALYVWWVVADLRGKDRAARIASTLGLLAYLFHVWCAFEYLYQWSHAIAYRETARQTAELFGVRWGGGLYLNYLFTAVWAVVCIGSWLGSEGRRSRPGWAACKLFLAFMWVNATVVVWLLRAVR